MKKYSFRRAASLLVAAALALGLAGCGKSPQPADSSASSQAVQSTPHVQPQAAAFGVLLHKIADGRVHYSPSSLAAATIMAHSIRLRNSLQPDS